MTVPPPAPAPMAPVPSRRTRRLARWLVGGAVVVAAELALQAGRVSGEHVLNTLARLKESPVGVTDIDTPLKLQTPPVANTARYDGLRRTGVMA